jgi:hypothetical protein
MKLLRTLTVTAVGLAASLAVAHAQSTVTFTAAPGQRAVALSTGQPLDYGNYVKLGYFNTGFDVAQNTTNLLALASAWREFGFATIQDLGGPGRFAEAKTLSDSAFDAKKIWWWVFCTRDNAIPDPAFANVLEYGLFSSDSSAWRFPLRDAIPPSNTTMINSSEVNESPFGSFDDNYLYLAHVPEPSIASLWLAGLGSLAFASKRRKLW